MTTASLLTSFEKCQRAGFWDRSWQRHRLTTSEALHAAVRAGLLSDREDFGESAGESFIEMARDRGLEGLKGHQVYPSAIHHACLADILVSATRKPGDEPWVVPEPITNWTPSCLMDRDGSRLRQFLAVSYWNEDRQRAAIQSWSAIGEVCTYNMPMQLVVAVIGNMREGRRSSPWTRGYLHPSHKGLRFRRRGKNAADGFNERWLHIWREDHDEITRDLWIQRMAEDSILQEQMFVVDVEVPEQTSRHSILQTSEHQLEALQSASQLPGKALSVCNDPIRPCEFRCCCWSQPESLPSDGGFDSVFLDEAPQTELLQIQKS